MNPTRWLAMCLLVAAPAASEWLRDRDVILEGGLVTMRDEGVLAEGRLWIRDGLIRGVFDSEAALTAAADVSDAERLASGGWIFPGFVNLHTHLPFNHQPVWVPEPATRKFANRYQWQVDASHLENVMRPKELLFGAREYNLLNEQTLYAEVRALVGGTTALTNTRDPGIYTGAGRLVRNIEHESQVEVHIPAVDDVFVRDVAPRIRERLDSRVLRAWVAHVAEGVDDASREEFDRLERAGLLRKEVVIVHGAGLDDPQLGALGAVGGHLVWAPTSNLLLYGKTADVASAMRRGVTVSLSNDWAPSGPPNLLAELKVAAAVYETRYGSELPAKSLVEMITTNPARAIGWDDLAGSLVTDARADVVVIGRRGDDPYSDLIASTEEDVALVLVDGEPLFGRDDWMERLKPGDSELLSTIGRNGSPVRKRIDVTRRLGDASLHQTRRRLEAALRFERNDMLAQFLADDGSAIEASALTRRLDTAFSGARAHELVPIFLASDRDFFARLRAMRFPHTDVLIERYRPFESGSSQHHER